MPAFHYVAIDATGVEQKGVIEADSEKQARQLLRDRSLLPTNLSVMRGKAGSLSLWQALGSRRVRLSSQDIALFTRQFSTLLAAGLPVEESLLAVAEQSEKAKQKGLILSIRSKVLEGHSLASALKDFPDVFSELFCATVAAGEKSGYLDKVLLRLADYTEQQSHIQQKLKSALIYPATIVIVAISIVGFLLQYVVPKLVAVYGRLKQALPLMTEILIGMSQFISHYGFYTLIILIILLISYRYSWKHNARFKEANQRFFLRLPFIGFAMKTADTARFSRTLSILSASGVPVIEAMTIAASLITTIPIKHSVTIAVSRVREGAAISLALKQTGYFSPMSVHMMASGEASGQLENMLERIAINQENEILRLIDVGLALFEPGVILVMGAVVLFIVLAVLLPIFQLNQFAG